MAILNPDHLFDQAGKLAAPPVAGAPRQVDLRRALSSAYYGMFHFTLAALADEMVGKTERNTSRYALVYRSIDHRNFKELCNDIKKPDLPKRYLGYIPQNGFGENIQAFATVAVDLQEARHAADYNPLPRFKASEVEFLISSAVSAVRRFERAKATRRKMFLTLLLCPPRA